MVAGDEFLEWADVFGNLYGTSRAETEARAGGGHRSGAGHRRAGRAAGARQAAATRSASSCCRRRSRCSSVAAPRPQPGPGGGDRAAARDRPRRRSPPSTSTTTSSSTTSWSGAWPNCAPSSRPSARGWRGGGRRSRRSCDVRERRVEAYQERRGADDRIDPKPTTSAEELVRVRDRSRPRARGSCCRAACRKVEGSPKPARRALQEVVAGVVQRRSTAPAE